MKLSAPERRRYDEVAEWLCRRELVYTVDAETGETTVRKSDASQHGTQTPPHKIREQLTAAVRCLGMDTVWHVYRKHSQTPPYSVVEFWKEIKALMRAEREAELPK